MLLPWQEQMWLQITGEGLPSAILISGPRGVGKLLFARRLAQALLCENPGPNRQPCETCLSCHWCRQQTHPDLRLLQPEKLESGASAEEGEVFAGRPKQGGHQISVEQVRAIGWFLELSAHRRGRKVVLLHPAEALNANAANALLKTLEEPPQDTVFLLVAHRVQQILPTVRSRCRALPARIPTPAESIAWLAGQGISEPGQALSEAGFAPLRAVENARGNYRERRKAFLGRLTSLPFDAVAHAAVLDARDLPDVLEWLQKWTYDLMGARLANRIRYNHDFAPELRQISARAEVVQLGRLFRFFAGHRSRLAHPLNPRLTLERLLLSYESCVAGTHR
jgi:DNA polymerase-3 subunit delta'